MWFKTFIFFRCELAGTVNDSINFTDMGLKCWRFYSNVGDTTLKARAVSGQSIFVKKDEEKFYGEDEGEVIVL